MTNKPKIKPLLPWVGGKRQLLKHLNPHIPHTYNTYYEPFLGGGALLLHLQPTRATVGDLNPWLINAWKQIRDNVDEVISVVENLNAQADNADWSKNHFFNTRERWSDTMQAGERTPETAGLFLWCLKYSFGAKFDINSKGRSTNGYRSPAQGAGQVDFHNLKQVSHYLRNNDIAIVNSDWEPLVSNAKPGDFIFYDPPYMNQRGTQTNNAYSLTSFNQADRERLAKIATQQHRDNIHVLATEHEDPQSNALWSIFNCETHTRTWSLRVGNRYGARELIISNTPRKKEPAHHDM